MEYCNNNNSFCLADMKLLHFNINECLQEIKIKKGKKIIFHLLGSRPIYIFAFKILRNTMEAGESKLKAHTTILNSF